MEAVGHTLTCLINLQNGEANHAIVPMALHGKVEAQVELKSSAEKYYNMWRKEAHKIPTITSDNVQGIDLHEGNWESHGSVKSWSYTVDGKVETFKEKVEYDDANLSFTLHGYEGHVFIDRYKVFRTSCKLIPKDRGCTARLTMEYEKMNDDVPDADKYMEVYITITKDIDAHACEP